MCLQCSTDAVSYDKQVIPGWYLMRATKDAWDKEPKEWRKDEWGLIKMNDPAFVWTKTPAVDPLFDVPDDKLDNHSFDTPEYKAFNDAVCDLEDAMQVDPMTGYNLITAAKTDGYDPDVHGYRFSSWLVHRMGLIVRDGTLKPHDAESVNDD